MEKSYYIEYYHLERNNWWFKARMDILRSQVAKIANGRKDLNILNVGAATGASSLMLQEFGAVTSIEYDEDCFAFTKERVNIPLEIGSILDIKYPNNHYDLVCAFDVIEHVEEDQKAASELIRVCKNNGYILVTVPAFNFLWSEHDEINHHFTRYTRKKFTSLFQAANIDYATYFNSILFFPIAAVRLLFKLIPVKRKGSGSDFSFSNAGWQNSILYPLFKMENAWIKRNIALPFGVSILARIKKPA